MRKLTLALSAVPDVEIACIDSAERFDDNKAYLEKRAESENNLKVKRLLKKDEAFLDGMPDKNNTNRGLTSCFCNTVLRSRVIHTVLTRSRALP